MNKYLPFYYGWIIVSVTCFILFVTSGIIMTFGVFVESMTFELKWSKTDISIGIALFMLLQGLFSLYVGSLLDRYGPRKVISIGTFCLGIVFSLLSLVSTLWQFVLIYGVLTALAYTTTTIVTCSALIARRFTKRRGLAIGITMSGLPLGPLIFSPVITYLVLTFGWRQSFIILGLLMSFILFPLVLLVIKNEPSCEIEFDGSEHKQTDKAQLNFKCLLTNNTYLKLAGAYFTCGFTMAIISNHYHGHTVMEGFDLVTGSNTLALMGFLAFFGTILSGYLSDLVKRKLVLSIVYFIRGISFVLFAFASSFVVLIIAAVLFGISWTSTGPLTSALAGRVWGVEKMGKVFGAIFLMHQIGASIGAFLGGLIFDYTHSYFVLFILGGMLLFVGSLLIYFTIDLNSQSTSETVLISSTRD